MQCENVEQPENFSEGFYSGLSEILDAFTAKKSQDLSDNLSLHRETPQKLTNFSNNNEPIINELFQPNKKINNGYVPKNHNITTEDYIFNTKVTQKNQNKIDNNSNVKHKDDELAFLKDFNPGYDDIDEEFGRLCCFQSNGDPIFADQDAYQEILKDPIIQEQLKEESRLVFCFKILTFGLQNFF
jgi:hypothetical protein